MNPNRPVNADARAVLCKRPSARADYWARWWFL